MIDSSTPMLMLVLILVGSLLGLLLGGLILFAIVRGAVLSALRKHDEDRR